MGGANSLEVQFTLLYTQLVVTYAREEGGMFCLIPNSSYCSTLRIIITIHKLLPIASFLRVAPLKPLSVSASTLLKSESRLSLSLSCYSLQVLMLLLLQTSPLRVTPSGTAKKLSLKPDGSILCHCIQTYFTIRKAIWEIEQVSL